MDALKKFNFDNIKSITLKIFKTEFNWCSCKYKNQQVQKSFMHWKLNKLLFANCQGIGYRVTLTFFKTDQYFNWKNTFLKFKVVLNEFHFIVLDSKKNTTDTDNGEPLLRPWKATSISRSKCTSTLLLMFDAACCPQGSVPSSSFVNVSTMNNCRNSCHDKIRALRKMNTVVAHRFLLKHTLIFFDCPYLDCTVNPSILGQTLHTNGVISHSIWFL